jgi:hypothetical protein
MGETTKDGYTAPPASQINTEPGPDAPVDKKHTRVRKTPAAASPAKSKALEDVIAYLGCPVADNMSQEDIDEEVRKCRDLGIVVARRIANLYAAGTKNYAKKLAAVRDALS